ncbi:MAG: hypothetical protein Q8O57_12340 [Kiritimatiellota bacterium]|nr:hypothetical protein [Kiritimatiellota bacterium]
MKPNKTVDRIERELWNAGRASDPFAGGSVITGGADWQDGVMAAIRQIGLLEAPAPGRVHAPATAWSWAAAVAACLAIGIGWYAFNDLNADTVLAGLFLDDPSGWTVNMMLVEM